MWLPIDRDMVAAWSELDAQTCRDCGTRKDEWGWWDDEGTFHEFESEPYVVRSTSDPGCARIEARRERDIKEWGKLSPGARYYLTPGS